MRKRKMMGLGMNTQRCFAVLLLGVILLLTSLLVGCAQPTPPASPTIAFSPSSLSFSAEEGGANPASKTLSISNSGGGTLDWTVSDDANWLGLSPISGSNAGGIDEVTVSVNINGMDAGNYAAVITISASRASNAPQTLVVNLAVSQSGQEDEEQDGQEQNVIDALDTARLLDIGYGHPEQVVIVEGVIVGSYYCQSCNGQPTFLNFHDPYEGYFTALIWGDDRYEFPPNPESYYLKKKVRIEGRIEIYRGSPEIILRDQSQIWVVG